ncbi:MAG: metal-dependent transcriptional regulator [Evtepia sp.]
MKAQTSIDMFSNMQNYLVEILELHGHAHASEIASRLNVGIPSVTHALKKLKRMGFLLYNPNAPVVLTEKRRKFATDLHYSRETIVAFFEKILLSSSKHSCHCACALEHLIDRQTVKSLATLTNTVLTHADYNGLRDKLKASLFF